ncbi:MAG: hypothetical protein FWB75_05980 [Oscillospiraceae bacterium]|nr:hypothetical protein [Oscillospiraceae bacterium]
MSNKRILGITIFGIMLIGAAIGVLLLTSYLGRDSAAIELPETPVMAERPGGPVPDELTRIEVNRETVQAVIYNLSRPQVYSRDVVIESFWDGGQAVFTIGVNTYYGNTSLFISPPVGPHRRIIVTGAHLYIWYEGDAAPFVGIPSPQGDGVRTADEWNMLLTFENIMNLNGNDIIDAGITEHLGEICLFVVYNSAELGNTRRYYVSVDLGLVISAEVHDFEGRLIYKMTAGEASIGLVRHGAFTLPDGTEVID